MKSVDIPLCKLVWKNGIGVVPKLKYAKLYKLCGELKSEVQKNIAAAKELYRANTFLENEIKSKEEVIKLLEATNSNLESEMTSLKERRDFLETHVKELNLKVRRLKAEKIHSKEDKRNAKCEHVELLERLQLTNDMCKRFATETQRLKTQLLVAENKVQEHKFVIKHLENSQAILSRSLKIKEVEHEILQRDLQDVQTTGHNGAPNQKINGDAFEKAIHIIENSEDQEMPVENMISTSGRSNRKYGGERKMENLNIANGVKPKSTSTVGKQNWTQW